MKKYNLLLAMVCLISFNSWAGSVTVKKTQVPVELQGTFLFESGKLALVVGNEEVLQGLEKAYDQYCSYVSHVNCDTKVSHSVVSQKDRVILTATVRVGDMSLLLSDYDWNDVKLVFDKKTQTYKVGYAQGHTTKMVLPLGLGWSDYRWFNVTKTQN